MDCDFVLSYGKGGLDGLAEHELTSPPVGRKWQLDRQKQLGNAKIPDLAITNLSKDRVSQRAIATRRDFLTLIQASKYLEVQEAMALNKMWFLGRVTGNCMSV